MSGFLRRIAPFIPLSLTMWYGYDAVVAQQQGRTGSAIWEAVKALLFLCMAYAIQETGKRILIIYFLSQRSTKVRHICLA